MQMQESERPSALFVTAKQSSLIIKVSKCIVAVIVRLSDSLFTLQ